MIFFPFSYFVTEAVVLANHADTQLYLHVALRSVSLHLIFTIRIYAMILTIVLIFKLKATDLIHLDNNFKDTFTLGKNIISIPRILNRNLFMIPEIFFFKSNNKEESLAHLNLQVSKFLKGEIIHLVFPCQKKLLIKLLGFNWNGRIIHHFVTSS